MRNLTKIISALLISFFIISPFSGAMAVETKMTLSAKEALNVPAPSFILLEGSTGKVLYEKDADTKRPIASVTKIMTMLLAMEALDSGAASLDSLITTSEHAASYGGSQIYLEVGEQMSFNDILKGIAVSSGNDAACAMGEFLAGSEEAFVAQMNAKAASLGMQNTHFINANGLNEGTEAYSTARDVSIMSRALLAHSKITDYLTIWQEDLRGGEFLMSNTNRLIRFYEGANGIKTGSTTEAGYCLSASAVRDNMNLIAVVLGTANNDDRFGSAQTLLDFGFANYALYSPEISSIPEVLIQKGKKETILGVPNGAFAAVVPKSTVSKVETQFDMPNKISAPINAGDIIGKAKIMLDGELLAEIDIVASETIEKSGFFVNLWRMITKLFG
jgi:D-alanyl-D-alanine carboxypeptidase (penicillin-binding protein 5/6)